MLLVFGAMIGSLLSELFRGSQYFGWLALGRHFGISTANPFYVDLGVISFSFGLMFNITIASLIGIAIAIFVYRKI